MHTLKTLRTYISHAEADGFNIANPFKKMSLTYQPGDRQALDRDELNALREQLKEQGLEPIQREVLAQVPVQLLHRYPHKRQRPGYRQHDHR